MIMIRTIGLFWTSLHTSYKIHYNMIYSLLFAPINMFYDRVPLGRILNRLSKDLSLVDNDFPFIVGALLITTLAFL